MASRNKRTAASAAARDPLDGLPALYGEDDRLNDLAQLVKGLQRKLWLLEQEMETEHLGDNAPVINPQTGTPAKLKGEILTYGKQRAAIQDALRDLASRHPEDMKRLIERTNS